MFFSNYVYLSIDLMLSAYITLVSIHVIHARFYSMFKKLLFFAFELKKNDSFLAHFDACALPQFGCLSSFPNPDHSRIRPATAIHP